jgi:RiboL-PSP-HEPN
MPSASVLRWRNDRMLRLAELDAQCAACLASALPKPHLSDENLRGYAVLLCAHFQGYCRDLYTEAAQVIASKVRVSLRALVQNQFTALLTLDHGNPTAENLRKDFDRLGFRLNLAADPTNQPRLQQLAALNRWRNVAAHQGTIPAGVPLDLPSLRDWRSACDGLATSLDGILYNQLRRLLRRAPW